MSLDVDLLIPNDSDDTSDWEIVFEKNITHNLGEMAQAFGLYEAIWRPYRLLPGYKKEMPYDQERKFEEGNIVYANMIIDHIKNGLTSLVLNPSEAKTYNPDNGWGSYEGLVTFTIEYLENLENYPESAIFTCR